MPNAWSRKDENIYERIEQSERARGRTLRRAKEIAGRTVNKKRRQQGRAANRRSRGTGSPNRPLKERTKTELYNRARELHIAGRSRMSKAELVSAIRRKG